MNVHAAGGNEMLADPLEAFLSREGARQLVDLAVRERVDPLTHRVLPPDEGDSELWGKYTIEENLYGALVHYDPELDPASAKQVAVDQSTLEQTLTRHPGLKWHLSTEQSEAAYHIQWPTSPAAGSDGLLLKPASVYLTSGIYGTAVAAHVIARAPDIAYTKIWTPEATTRPQKFRRDTPIFTANTLEQLYSVNTALRAVLPEVPHAFNIDATSPLGVPIEGIPGAYLAQPSSTVGSFNMEMSVFWAQYISKELTNLDLQPGDVLTDEQLRNVTERVLLAAQHHAETAGRNPNCHALVAEQDLGVLIDAMRA